MASADSAPATRAASARRQPQSRMNSPAIRSTVAATRESPLAATQPGIEGGGKGSSRHEDRTTSDRLQLANAQRAKLKRRYRELRAGEQIAVQIVGEGFVETAVAESVGPALGASPFS